MPAPRQIRGDESGVTLAHMRDAIRAGVAPVRSDVHALRLELRELREDVTALAQSRGRLRRWASENAGTAIAHAASGLLIAVLTGLATYFGTHL